MLQKSKIKMGSNRNFGLVFFVVFFAISLWPLINNEQISFVFLFISLVFLFLGFLNSKILTPLNIVWFKFGKILGLLIAPIVMGLVYFAVVTPTGFLMKLFNKDILKKKFIKEKKTYWINRDKNKSTMKQQF